MDDVERWPGMPGLNPPELEDEPPVEINLLRHIAGDYDEVLGQLCMRCGLVLDEGLSEKCFEVGAPVPRGWPAGATVLVTVGGGMLCLEASMRADRDRSDEADCESIL